VDDYKEKEPFFKRGNANWRTCLTGCKEISHLQRLISLEVDRIAKTKHTQEYTDIEKMAMVLFGHFTLDDFKQEINHLNLVYRATKYIRLMRLAKFQDDKFLFSSDIFKRVMKALIYDNNPSKWENYIGVKHEREKETRSVTIAE